MTKVFIEKCGCSGGCGILSGNFVICIPLHNIFYMCAEFHYNMLNSFWVIRAQTNKHLIFIFNILYNYIIIPCIFWQKNSKKGNYINISVVTNVLLFLIFPGMLRYQILTNYSIQLSLRIINLRWRKRIKSRSSI